MERNDIKQAINEVRAEMNEALRKIAEKHGMQRLEATSASYTSGGAFSIKVEAVMNGGKSKEASHYEFISKYSGTKLPKLGAKFADRQCNEHEIIGANTTGSKVLTASRGKTYLWPTTNIEKMYAQQPSRFR